VAQSLVGGHAQGADRLKRQLALSDLPLILLLLVVTVGLALVPVIYVFIGSVREGIFDEKAHYSLRALKAVYTTSDYLIPLLNSLRLGAAVTLFSVLLGGLLAWIVGRTDVPKRGALHLMSIMPLFVSSLMGAMAWVNLAAPRSGYLNILLNWLLGGPTHVAYLNIFSFWGIVWCMTFFLTPIAYLLMVSAFQRMDPTLEEAAGACGAGTYYTLRHITVPVLRPAVLAASLYVFVLTVEMFSIPAYLGSSIHFFTLPLVIFTNTTVYPADYSAAAATATMLLIVTLLGLYFYRRATGASRRFVTVGARGYTPRITKLGRWKNVAFGACLLYCFLGVLLPVAALVMSAFLSFNAPTLAWSQFTTDNFVTVLSSPMVLRAIVNTLVLAFLTALGAIALAMAVVYVNQRTRLIGRGLIDYISSVPIAVPGIVYATGLLWVYVGTPVYATIAILLIAYVTRQIPYANRSIGSGLMQVDADLEDSARVCGANTFQALRLITLPLLRPVLVATAIYIFLAAVRELNASILLYSSKSVVLSVVTWNYMYEGDFNQGSVVALLQTGVVLVALLAFRPFLRIDLAKSGPSM
jgi:iron(III) transport system permease protein